MKNQLPEITVNITDAQEEGKTRLSLTCKHKGEKQSVAMFDLKALQALKLKDILRMLRSACEFLEVQCNNEEAAN